MPGTTRILRRRLAPALIAPIILLSAIATAGVLVFASLIVESHDRADERDDAQTVAELVIRAVKTYRSPMALQDYLATLSGESLVDSIVVVGVDSGRIITSSLPEASGKPLERFPDKALVAYMALVTSGAAPEGLSQQRLGPHIFVQRVRVSAPLLEFHGERNVVIGMRLDSASLHALERNLALAFAIWTLSGAAVLVWLVLWILRRRVFGPVEAIEAVVQQRRAGVRPIRIHIDSRDELGELAQEINAAMDAIDAREAQIRKLALVAQGSRNAAMIASPDGVIEWVNAAFGDFFGYTQEEVKGRRPREFLHGPATDLKKVQDAWDRMREGKATLYEAVAYAKDGHEVVVSVQAYPIVDEDGAVTSCVLVATDITESRKIRQEVVATLTRMQQDLAFDLHDHIGGDLGGLAFRARSLAERLKASERPEAQLADELTANLGVIAERTRALSRMLAPTSPEQGGLPSALVHLCQTARTYCTAAVRLRMSEQLPPLEDWEANHVYLIAQESLRNAIQHGQPSRIHLMLAARPERLVLQVTSDQNPWSPEEHADGLGMRILRFRADTLNATLSVRVRSNGVTQMKLILPVDWRPTPRST